MTSIGKDKKEMKWEENRNFLVSYEGMGRKFSGAQVEIIADHMEIPSLVPLFLQMKPVLGSSEGRKVLRSCTRILDVRLSEFDEEPYRF